MKLKYLAAFLVLLAIGCTQQPSSPTATPAPDAGEAETTSAVESATETQLASTVSFDVTGMK